MAIETEIEVQESNDERFPYIVGLKTKDFGIFYGYGETEEQAIKDAEQEMNFWLSKAKQR